MPPRGPSRFIPLLVSLALLSALLATYGPGVLRAWQCRARINGLLADVRGGKLQDVPKYVVQDQQLLIRLMIQFPGADSYVDELETLKLQSYYREENHIWSIVMARTSGDIFGQAKLRWEFEDGKWCFDPTRSYYRPGVTGEQEWRSLPELTKLGREAQE